ncbi:hypothetical protein D3C85_880110 [compost metagenome]
MAVETKAGWIYAVRELDADLAEGIAGVDVSTKAEVVALEPIAVPATATAEDVATKVNEIIAALKA